MKRLHVHVAVADLQEAIAFYNTLFAAEPTVQESDYAKWMLDDPRVNFAISMRGRPPGLDHLGLQVESDDELQQVASALAASGRHVIDEPNAQCCYATGN
ncbi:MAG: VOC family protein, partial [Pseudomonadota bacterium]